MISWEEGFSGYTIDPIFPAEHIFDSTEELVDYIVAHQARIEQLLKYFLEFPYREEIATLATELSSSLAALKFGVARKRLDSVRAGI